MSSSLQQHGSLPGQPPGNSKQLRRPPRFCLNHGRETQSESEAERNRERERDGEKPAWPVGNFNKRQSDFSETIIIKILAPRLFVWGGHGWLRVRRRKFRAVINSPKWLMLDGRQGQGLLLLLAGTVSPSMSHSIVGWHVSRAGGNGESAFITCSFVSRGLSWSARDSTTLLLHTQTSEHAFQC